MNTTFPTAAAVAAAFLMGLVLGRLLPRTVPESRPAAESQLGQLAEKLNELVERLSEAERRVPAPSAEPPPRSVNAADGERHAGGQDLEEVNRQLAALVEDVRHNTGLLLRLAAAEDARYQQFFQRGMRLRSAGELAAADAELTKAIELRPELFNAYVLRGVTRMQGKHWAAALSDFEAARRLNPQSADALNNIAWIRATCPEEEFRSGEEAVAFAREACELSEWKNAARLSTLAAAYAEQGDFAAAVQWQERCLEAAADEEKAIFEEALRLYQSGKPMRDGGERVPPSGTTDE